MYRNTVTITPPQDSSLPRNDKKWYFTAAYPIVLGDSSVAIAPSRMTTINHIVAFPTRGRWRFRNAVEKMTDEVNIPNYSLNLIRHSLSGCDTFPKWGRLYCGYIVCLRKRFLHYGTSCRLTAGRNDKKNHIVSLPKGKPRLLGHCVASDRRRLALSTTSQSYNKCCTFA
jgi:hypothetical protein